MNNDKISMPIPNRYKVYNNYSIILDHNIIYANMVKAGVITRRFTSYFDYLSQVRN